MSRPGESLVWRRLASPLEPADPADLVHALLEASRGEEQVFLQTERATRVGVGVAREVRASGADRFASVQRRASEIFDRLDPAEDFAASNALPELYGGFAFAAETEERRRAARWREFPDARFVLPRLTLRIEDGEASWLAAVEGGAGGEQEFEAWWRPLVRRMRTAEARRVEPAVRLASNGGPASASAVSEPDRAPGDTTADCWRRQVADALEDLAAGRLEKVVGSLCFTTVLAERPDNADLVRRLARRSRSSLRFLYGREESTFFGSTPERLIAAEDGCLRTHALAGSLRRGPAAPDLDAARRQFALSDKDRREHSIVVEHLSDRLRPLCRDLEVSADASVLELQDLFHLETSIVGRLDAPRHVVELVAALHPTPAVGGVPVGEAMRWISAHEPHSRGWYAGPVGRFDARGDGEFFVALRSCLVTDRSAHLFAGAGLVRGSQERAELAEIEQKLLAARSVLEPWAPSPSRVGVRELARTAPG